MTTTDIAPDTIVTSPDATVRAGGASLATWLTSADSKVIGRNMIVASILAFAATVVVGVLLGAERIDGAGSLFDADALPQLFVAFRIGLVYGALIPLLLGLAVAVVPLQVGARSLAFPRLAAAGFWSWLCGFVIMIVALADNGGPAGGNEQMVDLFIAGNGLLVIGLAAPAVSVATTVLTTRAPGMRMSRLPFFAWSALVAVGRPAARAAGRARHPRLPVRRPPDTPGRCSAATSASGRGSASPSRSRRPTCSPCRPSASPPS